MIEINIPENENAAPVVVTLRFYVGVCQQENR